ncbi:MAG: alpha/beta hydrolase [Myxococcaceae bacterium]
MRVSEPVEAKTAPFDLGPRTAKAHVLLVHGFTGSPWDVRPLGEALASSGFHVKGVQLPGHSGVDAALPTVGWREWESEVNRALKELSHHGPVHLAGLSMGALLSVIMAARHPHRVRSLILVAPAMDFIGPTMTLVKALRNVPILEKLQPWVTKSSTDISDDAVRSAAPVLERFPTAWLRSLFHLQAEARAVMTNVRCPALIVAAENDHVVSVNGARELARSLRGYVRLVRVAKGNHIIPRDRGAPVLFDEATAFLDRVASGVATER